jgi:hypothetical protein
MRQECLDLVRAHLSGMAFAMKQDVAAYPIDVGALGTNRVVSDPHNVPSLIEQFLLGLWSARVLACSLSCIMMPPNRVSKTSV